MKYDRIDLVCDVGEGFGLYNWGDDAGVIKYLSAASVACGFHAGDPVIMRKTLELAASENVLVGAHVGFPDRLGFGRRYMKVAYEDLRDYIIYQIGALDGMAKYTGVTVDFLKLHGALARMSIEDEKLAVMLVELIADYRPEMIITAFWESALSKQAREAGLRVSEEVLIDRGYSDRGIIISHGNEGAITTDQEKIMERFKSIISSGQLELFDGTREEIDIQAIGFHLGSTELATIKRMNSWLRENNVRTGRE